MTHDIQKEDLALRRIQRRQILFVDHVDLQPGRTVARRRERAAQEEGLLTSEQVDQVLTRAAADLAEMSGETAPGAVVGSASDCEGVMEQIRSAAS